MLQLLNGPVVNRVDPPQKEQDVPGEEEGEPCQ